MSTTALTVSGAIGPGSDPGYVPSNAALDILGIKPQTLYTYVSRGLIRRIGQPGARTSFYNLHDILRLRARSRARSGHGPVAASAMHWGEPILETAITEITAGGPRYRDHLAVDLARDGYSFEAVAEYLWTGRLLKEVTWKPDIQKFEPPAAPPRAPNNGHAHIRHILTKLLVHVDQARDDRRNPLGVESAQNLICRIAGALGYLGPRCAFSLLKDNVPVALSLARILGIATKPENIRALNAALVLVADHELTSPTFVARISASVGCNLESSIVAALQVHFGSVLALCCDRIDDLIEANPKEATGVSRPDPMLMTMRAAPGFDHPLYASGDPRARMMVELALSIEGRSRRATQALDALQSFLPDVRTKPYLCEALVVLCRGLGTNRQAAGGLLALGRSAGWIAHVMEQRRHAFLIRPRGKFVAQSDEAQ